MRHDPISLPHAMLNEFKVTLWFQVTINVNFTLTPALDKEPQWPCNVKH